MLNIIDKDARQKRRNQVYGQLKMLELVILCQSEKKINISHRET